MSVAKILVPKVLLSKVLNKTQSKTRCCAVDACAEEGSYPAPRSRDKLRDYVWFCLNHVRSYNKSWNYFNGLQGPDLEAAIRNATVWERPSWRFGSGTGRTGTNNTGGNKARFTIDEADDPFNLFGPAKSAKRAHAYAMMDKEERAAWRVFDIEPSHDPIIIKQRYNVLAKQNHPDHNQGDTLAEERLKEINLAYSTLRKKRVNRQSTN